MNLQFFFFIGFMLSCHNASAILESHYACKAYKNNDLDGATTLLNGLVNNDPDNDQALYNLGKVAYKKGEFETATAYFSKAALAPHISPPLQEQALFDLGNSQAQLKQWPEAIESYEAVLKRNPDHEPAKKTLEQIKKIMEQEKQKQQQDEQKKDQEKKIRKKIKIKIRINRIKIKKVMMIKKRAKRVMTKRIRMIKKNKRIRISKSNSLISNSKINKIVRSKKMTNKNQISNLPLKKNKQLSSKPSRRIKKKMKNHKNQLLRNSSRIKSWIMKRSFCSKQKRMMQQCQKCYCKGK